MIPRLNHTHSFKVTAYSPFAQGKAIRGKGVLQEEVVESVHNYPRITNLLVFRFFGWQRNITRHQAR